MGEFEHKDDEYEHGEGGEEEGEFEGALQLLINTYR